MFAFLPRMLSRRAPAAMLSARARTTGPRVVGSLLAAALSAAHCAVWAATPLVVDIPPRGFDEYCLRLAAGESIRWRFTATAPVEFNIHYHRGDQVFYPVRRGSDTRASGSFRGPAADDYCLMWTNPASVPVSVRGAVERRP